MPDAKLEVRPAGEKGRGVFAAEPIPRGTPVVAMSGRLLATADLTDDLLALQVGPDLWLCSDGTAPDDMMNHSCDPNAGFAGGTLVLHALRDIAAGEEVCWDYSTSLSEPGWELACRCGAAGCRGAVRAWGELAPADRERLRGSALGYLRDMPEVDLSRLPAAG